MRLFIFFLLLHAGVSVWAHQGEPEASHKTETGKEKQAVGAANMRNEKAAPAPLIPQAGLNGQPLCVRNVQGVMHCLYLPGAKRH